MAEVALGAFGASIAVFQTLRGLQKLVDTFEELSHASTEIAYFHRETRVFLDVLDTFFNAVDDSFEYLCGSQKEKRRDTVNYIIDLFDSAKCNIKTIAKKVDNSNHEIKSVFWKLGIRFRWLSLRNSLTCLRLKMESLKTSANVLISTIVCEGLNRRIRDLERDMKQVETRMRKKLKYLTKRLVRAQADADQAAKALISYKRSHMGVEDILPDEEEEKLLIVEQDIQKDADEVVSCNQQRLSSRRDSGETPVSLRSNTASKPDRDFIIPFELQEGSGTARKNPRPRSGASSYTKPPSKEAPRDTSTKNHPSISIRDRTMDNHSHNSLSPDTDKKSNVQNPKVYGDRVRDDGTGVHVERGEWPRNVFTSSDQLHSSTAGNIGSSDVSEGLLNTIPDIPSGKTGGNSSKTCNHTNGSEKGKEQCDEDVSDTKKPNSQPDYDKGKWKPLPPFDDNDWKDREGRQSDYR